MNQNAEQSDRSRYGTVQIPVLPLIGWFDPATGKVTMSKQAADHGGSNGKDLAKRKVKPVQVELNDEIPF